MMNFSVTMARKGFQRRKPENERQKPWPTVAIACVFFPFTLRTWLTHSSRNHAVTFPLPPSYGDLSRLTATGTLTISHSYAVLYLLNSSLVVQQCFRRACDWFWIAEAIYESCGPICVINCVILSARQASSDDIMTAVSTPFKPEFPTPIFPIPGYTIGQASNPRGSACEHPKY